MKKIILALLFIFVFTSCASNDDAWSLSCGDTSLSPGSFYAQAVTYKNDFLQGYLGLTEDSASIWTQDSPSGGNESVADSLMRMVVEDMTQFVWVVEYAKDNGAVVTEEEKESLQKDFEEMKSGFTDNEAFLEYIGKLNVTEEELHAHLNETLYYDKGFEMLTSEGGLYAVSDEDLLEYYKNNFYTVKHVFFNDVTSTDEEGNTVTLTEEGKAEKLEKAKKVIADLDEGIPFETLYMLSEDGASTSFPDGMTIAQGFTSDASYEEEVMALDIGEYKLIIPDNGGVYVVKRMPVDEGAFEEYYDYVYSAVCQEITEKIYSDHKNEVTVNYDLINTFDIKAMPVLN
ncbi:MAG: hypothetical protein IJ323_04960 [Clostridia bacterium]|nr:hypothetical protein [Clostridia bacterium]MBQ7897757.1 hypothetical protein [Clostridia bacterium]